MYGPAAVGVGEWYVYDSVSGVEGPGADGTTVGSTLAMSSTSDMMVVEEMKIQGRVATRLLMLATDAEHRAWRMYSHYES
jgi:hypothetical protein